MYAQKSNFSYKFTVEQPNNVFMLKYIQILDNSTKLEVFTSKRGSISKYSDKFYILDKKTNIKYELKEELTNFGDISPNSHNSLFFDKIPSSTTDIDLIQGSCKSECWNIYGININKSDSIKIIDIKNNSFKMTNFLKNQFNNVAFFMSRNRDCNIKFKNNIYSLVNNANNIVDTWESLIEDVTDICEDPINSNIMYCITPTNKVLKSTDTGNNWILIQNGLPPKLTLEHIYINPNNLSELYLLTSEGIFITSDAGFSWSLFLESSNIFKFAIDFNKKNRFFIHTSKGEIFTKDNEEIEWKKISDNLPKKLIKGTGRTAEYKPLEVLMMTYINFISSSYLLAATEKGTFITYDNGGHWVLVNNDFILSAYIYNNDVYFSGSKSITDQSPVLYQSDLNGQVWNKIEVKNNALSRILSVFKDSYHSGLFIASLDGKISYIDSNLNLIGLNYGLTTHSIIHSQAEAENNGNKIKFALIENNHSMDIANYGIWTSSNNGITWNESFIYEKDHRDYSGLRKMYISPFNPGEIWSFDNFYQTYVTFNGGKTWIDFLDEKYIDNDGRFTISDFSFDYQNKDILYFAIQKSYEQDYSLYRFDRKTRGTTILRECGHSFIVSKDNNKNIITSKFEMSNDGGWTWHSIFDKLDKYFHIKDYSGADKLTCDPIEYSEKKIILHIYNIHSFIAEQIFNEYVISYDNGESWQILKK